MNPSDLPEVTKGHSKPRWWVAALRSDEVTEGNDDPSIPRYRRSSTLDNNNGRPPLQPPSISSMADSSIRAGNRGARLLRSQPVRLATQHNIADKFLGPATSSANAAKETLPRFIIHPLDWKYRSWWYTTVLVAAITSILEPYVIAFTAPGLYPYNSATSILEFVCIALIAIDMLFSFNVARYDKGVLVTDRRQLAKNYTRLIFWIDFLSIFPFDEVALTIAGLRGPNYIKNPVLAQYLSLFKIIRMLRLYRLSWFFQFLTYNLASSLLMVTLLRNIFLFFFFANVAACVWFFEARQRGFSEDTWVGATDQGPGVSEYYDTSQRGEMYIFSLYWSIMTMATIGYGDIRAFNMSEAIIAILWTTFSFFFTAFIIGSVTLVVVKGDERAGKYRDHMQVLQRFSAAHDLPDAIRESMLRHLKLYLKNENASDEVVLAKYPTTIRRQVLQHLYMPALQEVYLFFGAKPRFMDALLAAGRVELYLPNVDILSPGDFVSDLFVVVGGQVVEGGKASPSLGDDNFATLDISIPKGGGPLLPIDLENGSVVGDLSWDSQILIEGDAFGEVAFFTGTAQMQSVSTLTTVRVLSIPRAAYDRVAATFKGSARLVLTHLALHVEEKAMSFFPGPQGLEEFNEAMEAHERRMGEDLLAENTAAAEENTTMEGEDPSTSTSMPPPLRRTSTTAAVRLSPGQQAAIASYARVKHVVAERVAKHDEDSTSEWLNAAAHGDVSKLAEVLEHKFNVDTIDYDGRTALMIAAGRGNEEAVALLLRHGANPNIIDACKGSAMWDACRGGHDACIELLREHGASLGRVGVEEAGLLCTAVAEGDLKLLARLLRAGVNANAQDYDDRSALHVACSEGNVSAVEVLIVEGNADANLRDRWGLTPLEEASRVGARAVIMFLEAKAEADALKNEEEEEDSSGEARKDR